MRENEDAGPDPFLSAPALPVSACVGGCHEPWPALCSCFAHSSAPSWHFSIHPYPAYTNGFQTIGKKKYVTVVRENAKRRKKSNLGGGDEDFSHLYSLQTALILVCEELPQSK